MKDLGFYRVHICIDENGGLVFEIKDPASSAKIAELKKVMEQKFKQTRANNARFILYDEYHAERLDFVIR